MLITAIALFFLAAIFGFVILTAILQDLPTPKASVFIHGGVVISAIALVIIDIIKNGATSLLLASLLLFIVAALGGLVLFTIDMTKGPIPKWLAVLHPMVAFVGLITLIIDVLP